MNAAPPTGQPAAPRPPGAPLVSRRRVLAGAGALGAAAAVGGGAVALAAGGRPPAATRTGGEGVLVLVTCYGGNDGLNTVVPASDPAYRAGRPTLGYDESEVLPLADGLGLNPKMPKLKARWDAGQLAVVRGVGYPDPSLSHFQSMDIWQTGTTGGVGPGWLGRWLDATGTDPMRAISWGPTLPTALRGERTAATAVTASTIRLPGRPALVAAWSACCGPGPDRSRLAAQVASSGADLLRVRSSLASLTGSPSTVPAAAGTTTGLGAQLGDVADLIRAGAPTRVYQVSLSSFDTHAEERAGHERLLGELDGAVGGFLDALATSPRAADVVVVAYSEFGRRVAENASGGTDHGAAAPVLVAGHGVRGGLVGEEPSLTDLDPSGNLRWTTDFRAVYATLLGEVLGTDPAAVLGGRFVPLRLLR